MTEAEIRAMNAQQTLAEAKKRNVQSGENFIERRALNEKGFAEKVESWKALTGEYRQIMADYIAELGFDIETITYKEVCPNAYLSTWTDKEALEYKEQFAIIKKLNAKSVELLTAETKRVQDRMIADDIK